MSVRNVTGTSRVFFYFLFFIERLQSADDTVLYIVITPAFNINRLGVLGLMLDDVFNHVFFSRCFSTKKKIKE